MKASELRIGNLVKFQFKHIDEVLPVTDIQETFCELRITNGKQVSQYKHIEPIPLTEDWLLKFGFSGKGIYHIKLNDVYKHLVIPFDKDDEARIEMPLGNGIMTIAKNIKYVHQLQNLYFALTGEELALDLAKQTDKK